MVDREDIVAAIVTAAGGEIIGRVRLQKAAYLLQQLGLESGFKFEYHHYGPYSRGLDNAVADAKAFGLIEERIEHRQIDGAGYSVFKAKGAEYGDSVLKPLKPNKVKSLLERFAKSNVTVLELAATMHWISESERNADWREETKRRKGRKASSTRLDQAESLLREIDLSPTL